MLFFCTFAVKMRAVEFFYNKKGEFLLHKTLIYICRWLYICEK